MRILLVGGSKSRKSMLAQELSVKLAAGGPMIYWATMIPTDNEDLSRIENHLQERAGWGFETLECPRNVLSAKGKFAPESTILFDSTTAILANEMFAGGEQDLGAGERTGADLLALSKLCRHFILVGDDLFRDGQTYGDLTEEYLQGLAHIARQAAAEFDVVCEVTAGLPKLWKGDLP